MGFETARRAFHEDERWRNGPVYVVVTEVAQMPEMARAFVFPPDPSREGSPWGPLIDVFGSDYSEELHRIVNSFGADWLYYSNINPATDREEPKASYVKSIDWDGIPAAIAAGIYRRDIPGTCDSEEVNAMGLEDHPSSERLQEFVSCAAMELESQGYFATRALSSDPRWRSSSIYLFGLDTYGNALFSGDPYSQLYGVIAPELNDHTGGPFGGRDVVSVGDAFGETFLYYSTRNPVTGMMQRKVTFVKRATFGRTTSQPIWCSVDAQRRSEGNAASTKLRFFKAQQSTRSSWNENLLGLNRRTGSSRALLAESSAEKNCGAAILTAASQRGTVAHLTPHRSR